MNKNKIHCGDSLEVLRGFGDGVFDLIVTSPPYADNRKGTYGGVSPDKYVEWFLPISEQLLRTLKRDGSFILNIKEKVVSGERHTYVLELILALRRQGWLWTEEYCWHKKNSYPGKWPNRFRDSWERCLHFTKGKKFKMNQEAVMVPIGTWAETRLGNLSDTERTRIKSQVGNGFGRRLANWEGRDTVYPSNVLHMATSCSNKGHSAVFPESLPEWFIKLFSNAGDLVLDPFMGSGTVGVVAKRLGRDYVGIDKDAGYCLIAEKRVNDE